jgi:hypothetical protein
VQIDYKKRWTAFCIVLFLPFWVFAEVSTTDYLGPPWLWTLQRRLAFLRVCDLRYFRLDQESRLDQRCLLVLDAMGQHLACLISQGLWMHFAAAFDRKRSQWNFHEGCIWVGSRKNLSHGPIVVASTTPILPSPTSDVTGMPSCNSTSPML